jgi:hypothetical protein
MARDLRKTQSIACFNSWTSIADLKKMSPVPMHVTESVGWSIAD